MFDPTAEKLLPDLTVREELVLLARTLWREGYDDHLAGHITIKLEDGSLLCNPWLLLWNELRPRDLIRIDLDGNRLEGEWPVPPGIPLHLELHKARDDIGVAVHSHPRWGTIWADLGQVPPCHDQSSALGGGEVVVVDEYAGPVNDADSARGAIVKMGGADMALLAHHGVFVVGKSVRAAHQRAVALEWRCRVAWQVAAARQNTGAETPTELPAFARQRLGRSDGEGFLGFWEAMARQELLADPSLLEG
jgi:L-ribulose-5-phosphate 4-epimerase